MEMNGQQSPFDLIQENWERIKTFIRDEYRLSDISYNTWIRDLTLLRVEDHLVCICIPSDQSMSLSYISNKFRDHFRVAVSELMGETYDISFLLEDTAQEDPADDQLRASAGNAAFENANLNPRYRFDTFVVGSSNKFAHSACLAVAESPGEAYNPLFLYGGAGMGKTHLMNAIGHFILEQDPSKKVLYVSSEKFTNEVIESIRSRNAANMTRFRDKYRTVDVLLVDDIQFIIGKDATQEEFFHTFNELHSAGKQIVISSDRPPRDIETLDERFRSRFEWGLIADIQPPDFETRMAILRRFSEETHSRVSGEVLDYIASNLRSNIRDLEGSVRKLNAHLRLESGSTLTLDTAKDILKDYISPEAGREVTPQAVANTVCEHYGVRFSSVASDKKNAELVLPRQVIMYICCNYTNETLDGIARLLGKKDHSTVMYGRDQIRRKMTGSEELRSNVEIILKKLNISP